MSCGLAAAVAIGWGVAAFGSVYPWAYVPLFLLAAGAGVAGLTRRTPWRMPRGLVAAFGCAALAMALQLVPIPRPWLARISPAGDRFLSGHTFGYAAAGAINGTPAFQGWHALSIAPDETTRSLAAFLALALFCIGLARALGGGGTTRLGTKIAFIGLAVALVALAQRFLTDDGTIYGFWKPIEGRSPFGPFVNRNHFAGWMAMALPVSLGVTSERLEAAFLKRRDWRSRVLWLSSRDGSTAMLTALSCLVMGLSLVLSWSRSGMVALVVALGFFSADVIRRRPTASNSVLLLMCPAVLLAAIGFWAGTDRIAAQFDSASWPDVQGRAAVWRDAARTARDFPLVGTGVNTFSEAMIEYQIAARDVPLHFAQAHNDYLQLAAEGGLLVGLPAAALLLLLVREVRRRFQDSVGSAGYLIRVGAAAGLTAIAVQELFDFSLQMPANAVLAAALAAIAIHQSPQPPKAGS